MVYSDYTKKRIIFYHSKGYKAPTIAKHLLDEGIEVSRRGVSSFLVRVERTGSMARRPGSGRPRKRTEEVKDIVERTMRADDETTAKELKVKLANEGYTLSKMTILRCRSELGWTYRGSSYCQMIREANKAKRLEWAQQYLHEAETGFLDVIFTDETSSKWKATAASAAEKSESPRETSQGTRTLYIHVQDCTCNTFVCVSVF